MGIDISEFNSRLKAVSLQFDVLYSQLASGGSQHISTEATAFQILIQEYVHINPWFTEKYILNSLGNIQSGLNQAVQKGLAGSVHGKGNKIAFLLNSDAPFEGLGEIIFAALNDFECLVKFSADLKPLFEGLLNCLNNNDLGLIGNIVFIDKKLPAFDGIVILNAFENETALTYLSKKPNLVLSRKGSKIALSGNETREQLDELAVDICRFFGRSNFSARLLTVPYNYDFTELFGALEPFHENAYNHRYFNHYEYHKSIFLINNIRHLDNGFLLITPDLNFTGKTGVLTYSTAEEIGASVEKEIEIIPEAVSAGLIGGKVPAADRLFYDSEKLSGFLTAIAGESIPS